MRGKLSAAVDSLQACGVKLCQSSDGLKLESCFAIFLEQFPSPGVASC